MDEEPKKQRIEFDTTMQSFSLGFAWSGYQSYGKKDKFIALIIGCLIIRFNFY